LSAKSNLYYYHDQHSLHNNNDALQSEHEQYTTACTAQHTNTANKSPQNSFPHTTFHNLKKSNHNSAANTLSTLNPSEFEAKANKNFAKKYGNAKSIKGLQPKFYDEDNNDDDDYCENGVLTSHYYLQKNRSNEDRKGKKSKR
jgi:hypothetical protein